MGGSSIFELPLIIASAVSCVCLSYEGESLTKRSAVFIAMLYMDE